MHFFASGMKLDDKAFYLECIDKGFSYKHLKGI